jgi:hypothetical protein
MLRYIEAMNIVQARKESRMLARIVDRLLGAAGRSVARPGSDIQGLDQPGRPPDWRLTSIKKPGYFSSQRAHAEPFFNQVPVITEASGPR